MPWLDPISVPTLDNSRLRVLVSVFNKTFGRTLA